MITLYSFSRSFLRLTAASLVLGSLAGASHATTMLSSQTLMPGQLVLSELMVDPSKVGDTAGEWFELYNPFSTAVDLNGLVVSSMNGATIEQFTVQGAQPLAARDHFVFGRSANTGTNGGVPVDYAWGSSLSLGNGADYLRIARPDGTALIHASWTLASAGRSFEIRTGTLPNFSQSDYTHPLAGYRYGLGDMGTPGLPNSHPLDIAGVVAPPVPEPETYAMLGLGLGCIALARYRKRGK